MMEVDILGTLYSIEYLNSDDDAYLNDVDGFCDKTSKRIVVKKENKNKRPSDIDDYTYYQKQVLRHEIIHAFLFESGLHNNFMHPECGHDETMIDWVAVQFPKILQIFKKVDCL